MFQYSLTGKDGSGSGFGSLENGSGGSGSTFGFGKNGSDGSVSGSGSVPGYVFSLVFPMSQWIRQRVNLRFFPW